MPVSCSCAAVWEKKSQKQTRYSGADLQVQYLAVCHRKTSYVFKASYVARLYQEKIQKGGKGKRRKRDRKRRGKEESKGKGKHG